MSKGTLALGLEVLMDDQMYLGGAGSAESASELIEAIVATETASQEMLAEVYAGERLNTAYENLSGIYSALAANNGKATPALEALVGNALGNGRLSMEGVGATIKKWWDTIVAWFKKMYERVKLFFKELFDRNAKWQRVLTEAGVRLKNKDVDDTEWQKKEQTLGVMPETPSADNAKEWLDKYKELPAGAPIKPTKGEMTKILTKLAQELSAVKELQSKAEKAFSDDISYAEKCRTAAIAANDPTAAASNKTEIEEKQKKRSDFVRAVSQYGKLLNTFAAQLVRIVDSAPAKTGSGDAGKYKKMQEARNAAQN